MKKVILTLLTLTALTTTAVAGTVRLDKLSRADVVAIQRGWNGSVVACFEWKFYDITTGKKDWVVTENVNKGYVELKDTTENFIWRCEQKGVRVYDEEGGWGYVPYEDYGW